MRAVLGSVVITLALAGCSKREPAGQEVAPSTDKTRSGADVTATVTPGVALTYAYSYRLPIQRVVAVQEQHAASCEELGPARCRIVGMHYSASANRRIDASLELRLAPALARGFGKSATAAAVAAGGMLAQSSIESIDAGRQVEASNQNLASLTAEGSQVESQIASQRGGADERAALQARAAALREAQRGARAEIATAQATLAETPLSIRYESGPVDPGFGDGPLLGAIKDGWANILTGLATILLILVTVVPWVLALALLIGIWSRIRRPVRRLLGLDEGRD